MVGYAKVVVGESNTVTDQDSHLSLYKTTLKMQINDVVSMQIYYLSANAVVLYTPMNVPLISLNSWVGCCKKILVIRNDGLEAYDFFPFLMKVYIESNW